MIVGLTGGIGSGKTLVSSMFKELGIPTYISDEEAKKIMISEPTIIKAIIQLFGKEAYLDKGVLNRTFISSQVFLNKEKLQKLNAIVHPAVAIHFKEWYAQQKAVFVVKESAILFETESYKHCDVVILVTAPEDIRIRRVIKRDNVDVLSVKNRIKNQWTDDVKTPLSDYIICNTNKLKTQKKVKEIFELLLKN